MKVKFEIVDHYAIRLKDRHIDLHNNFDLHEVRQDGDSVVMEFKRSVGEWVPDDELKGVTFIFKQVSYWHEVEGDLDALPSDKGAMADLTYSPETNRADHASMFPNVTPLPSDDLLFVFQDGAIYRVQCEEIEVITG